jgi:hypothetical protein
VHCQVDQDIDGVRANQAGQLVVGIAMHIAPDIHPFGTFFGDGIFSQPRE